jgi:uncharacterized protein
MEITVKQKQKIKEVAGKYRLKLVLLFGSQATGKIHNESDFDIAYFPEKNLSFDEEIDINFQFTLIFPQKDCRVDTVDIKHANPLLIFRISKENILLYGSREDFMKFKLRAFKMYNDYAPYFEMEKKLNKKIITGYVGR